MRFLVAAHDHRVGVEDGIFVEPTGAFDTVLELPGADVRPGLINGHDHLHRNHYGRLGRPPYDNAYRWAHDIQAHYRAHIADRKRLRRRDALLAGAWKNLFAGVTSVVHHDPWEPDFERDFPLHVPRIASADSLGMGSGWTVPAGPAPFCLHVAEGIDDIAAAEIATLDDGGLLRPNLVAVHGVGMAGDAIARFRASGAALIWCPSSNLFLFGRSAPAPLLRDGLDVLLGSDSLLTGAGDLLDEIAVARALGTLSDERLEEAVGATAARRLGLPAPSLEPGHRADLLVLAKPLLEARSSDVVLVVAGGIPRVARPELSPALNRIAPDGALTRVGSLTRWTNGWPAIAAEGRFSV